jgi:hypothetical protein
VFAILDFGNHTTSFRWACIPHISVAIYTDATLFLWVILFWEFSTSQQRSVAMERDQRRVSSDDGLNVFRFLFSPLHLQKSLSSQTLVQLLLHPPSSSLPTSSPSFFPSNLSSHFLPVGDRPNQNHTT